MSIIEHNKVNPHTLNYNDYTLAVKNSKSRILITMCMQKSIIHTSYLPQTHYILKSNLPQVLQSLCFNDSNLPFDLEVKDTEIGHLFEHVLLEYLCDLKIKNGHKEASFKGVTNWNWKIDAKGTFHIQIQIQPYDIEYFQEALEKSVALLNKILLSNSSSLKN